MRSIDLTTHGRIKHADSLYTLGLLANAVDRNHWCLVGGLMVLLNGIEAGHFDPFRALQTKDADVVVEITGAGRLVKVADSLRQLGLAPDPPFPGEDFARCTFSADNGTTVDVLAPEDADEGALELGQGLRSLAIPGGAHALASAVTTEIVYVGLDDEERDVEIRLPDWTDAVLVKGYAALDERTSRQPRHLDDLVDLLTAPSPAIAAPRAAASTSLPAAISALVFNFANCSEAEKDLALDRLAEIDALTAT